MTEKPDHNVFPTGYFPCQWDDLLVEGGTFATIYTKKHLDKDKSQYIESGIEPSFEHELPVGSSLCEEDGCWDIIVDEEELTLEIVQKALDELSKKTGHTYKFKYEEE